MRHRKINLDWSDVHGQAELDAASDPDDGAAQVGSPDVGEQIFDVVCEAGASPAASFLAVPKIEAILESSAKMRAYAYAAESLRHILQSLGTRSTAAEALRRVILGADGESGRDAAERLGVSHVALLKSEKWTRGKLGLPVGAISERPIERASTK